MALFPWEKMTDSTWKPYYHDWWVGIISELERCSIEHIFPQNQEEQNKESFPCKIKSYMDIQVLLQHWLGNWRSGHRYKGHYDKGIGTNSHCHFIGSSNNRSCVCNEFHIVIQGTDWKHIKYPWLFLYDSKLPVEGEFPFQPQSNWATLALPPKGRQFGFLDKSGNEWCWDIYHQDHWDVQTGGSTHLNVTLDGRIL
ncbi:polymorphic toxin type 17 domain-containing protein [Chloroflexota bacterium]